MMETRENLARMYDSARDQQHASLLPKITYLPLARQNKSNSTIPNGSVNMAALNGQPHRVPLQIPHEWLSCLLYALLTCLALAKSNSHATSGCGDLGSCNSWELFCDDLVSGKLTKVFSHEINPLYGTVLQSCTWMLKLQLRNWS